MKRIRILGLALVMLLTAVGCAAKVPPPVDGEVAFEEAKGAFVDGLSASGCHSVLKKDSITVFRSVEDVKNAYKQAKDGTASTTRSREEVFDEVLETLTPSFFEEKAVLIVPMKRNDTATQCRLQSLRIEDGVLVATVQKTTDAAGGGLKVIRWTSETYCVDAAAIAGVTETRIEETWEAA